MHLPFIEQIINLVFLSAKYSEGFPTELLLNWSQVIIFPGLYIQYSSSLRSTQRVTFPQCRPILFKAFISHWPMHIQCLKIQESSIFEIWSAACSFMAQLPTRLTLSDSQTSLDFIPVQRAIARQHPQAYSLDLLNFSAKILVIDLARYIYRLAWFLLSTVKLWTAC